MNNLGEYIKELRTKSKMSQDELASKLYVSRQAISNWECGKTYPDIDNLKILSEIFKVKLEDLIIGNSNKEEVTKYLYTDNIKLKKNKKKYITIYIISIILILILFLGYFFINTYNKVRVYSIYGNDSSINIESGLFVTTNETWFLSINNITTEKELDVTRLYFIIDGKERLIGYPYGSSIYLEENVGYQDLLPFDEKTTINNMYLDVYYTDGTKETLKLKFERKYDNSKLVMHKDVKVSENSDKIYDTFGIRDEYKELDKIIKENFNYNKGNYYSKIINLNNKKYNIRYAGYGGDFNILVFDKKEELSGRYSTLTIKGFKSGDVSYSNSFRYNCSFKYKDGKSSCNKEIVEDYNNLIDYIINTYGNNNN